MILVPARGPVEVRKRIGSIEPKAEKESGQR